MNVTASCIDIHCILTFHVAAASTEVLDITVYGDVAGGRGKVLDSACYLYPDNVLWFILAAKLTPVHWFAINIPLTVVFLDVVTAYRVFLAVPNYFHTAIDDDGTTTGAT